LYSNQPPAPAGAGKKKKTTARGKDPVTSVEFAKALALIDQSPPPEKTLTLHAGIAATVVGEMLALQAGRITERSRSGQSLGSLERYADEWNSSDMCDVTSGLGKDREPISDSRGPRPLSQQLTRVKRFMREHDMA
jgi:hypothetical protein